MKTIAAPLAIAALFGGLAACGQPTTTSSPNEDVSPAEADQPLTLPPQETAPPDAAPTPGEVQPSTTTPPDREVFPPMEETVNPDTLGKG